MLILCVSSPASPWLRSELLVMVGMRYELRITYTGAMMCVADLLLWSFWCQWWMRSNHSGCVVRFSTVSSVSFSRMKLGSLSFCRPCCHLAQKVWHIMVVTIASKLHLSSVCFAESLSFQIFVACWIKYQNCSIDEIAKYICDKARMLEGYCKNWHVLTVVRTSTLCSVNVYL